MQELPNVFGGEPAPVRRRVDVSQPALRTVLAVGDTHRAVADTAGAEPTLLPSLPQKRSLTERGQVCRIQRGSGATSDKGPGSRD